MSQKIIFKSKPKIKEYNKGNKQLYNYCRSYGYVTFI